MWLNWLNGIWYCGVFQGQLRNISLTYYYSYSSSMLHYDKEAFEIFLSLFTLTIFSLLKKAMKT